MRLPDFISRRLRQTPLTPGQRGERLAEKHLHRQGYRTLAKNLRTRLGEIDLFMLGPDGKTLVFVEVKTAEPGRVSSVPPEHRVGKHKQRKLATLAAKLIAKHKLTGRPVRFDVVGINLRDDRDADLRHYPHAFESPW